LGKVSRQKTINLKDRDPRDDAAPSGTAVTQNYCLLKLTYTWTALVPQRRPARNAFSDPENRSDPHNFIIRN
jgi:hypothetical protein